MCDQTALQTKKKCKIRTTGLPKGEFKQGQKPINSCCLLLSLEKNIFELKKKIITNETVDHHNYIIIA